jgi:hypothetical protein
MKAAIAAILPKKLRRVLISINFSFATLCGIFTSLTLQPKQTHSLRFHGMGAAEIIQPLELGES